MPDKWSRLRPGHQHLCPASPGQSWGLNITPAKGGLSTPKGAMTHRLRTFALESKGTVRPVGQREAATPVGLLDILWTT